MIQRFMALSVAFALSGGSIVVAAQEPPQPDETVLYQELLQRLHPAAFVSVRLKGGARLQGTLLQTGSSEFVIQPRTRIPVAARRIPYQEVASIDVRKRPMSAGRKVVTGVAVGLGAYLVMVVIYLSAGYD